MFSPDPGDYSLHYSYPVSCFAEYKTKLSHVVIYDGRVTPVVAGQRRVTPPADPGSVIDEVTGVQFRTRVSYGLKTDRSMSKNVIKGSG